MLIAVVVVLGGAALLGLLGFVRDLAAQWRRDGGH
jgi:hypothetical protein